MITIRSHAGLRLRVYSGESHWKWARILCCALLAFAGGCDAVKPLAFNSSSSNLNIFSTYKLTGDVQPVRDPSLTRQGGIYYAFSTDDGAPLNRFLQIRCSNDLLSWANCGQVFDTMPTWIQQRIAGVRGLWAPDISFFNGEYHLYYAASIFGTNRSLIGLATNVTLDSSDPAYAWVDRGEVLGSGPSSDFNAIDPNILIDPNGAIWLTYGSFWTGIKQAPVDPATGMVMGSNLEPFSLAARPSSESRAVEGGFVLHHANYYYLFASFGFCCEVDPYRSNYEIVVGRSTSVHGPFVDMTGVPMMQGGGTVLLAGSTGTWNAAGGQSLFVDPVTTDATMVFHAHRLPAGTPYLFSNKVTWHDDWPEIVE